MFESPDEILRHKEQIKEHDLDEHWRSFGRYLDSRRVIAGMQKGELAEAAGLSDTQLRHYIKGWRVMDGVRIVPNPSELTLHRLADALDVDPAEMCAEAGIRCSIPRAWEDEMEEAELQREIDEAYMTGNPLTDGLQKYSEAARTSVDQDLTDTPATVIRGRHARALARLQTAKAELDAAIKDLEDAGDGSGSVGDVG